MSRRRSKRGAGIGRPALVSVLALAAVVTFALSAPAEGERLLKVLDAATGRAKAAFTVEIAETLEEQIRGLQGREGIDPDRGMLFVYDEAAPRSFWMKEVSFALDFIFADAEGRIGEIMEDRPPCVGPVLRCPPYRSRAPARYVLELASGQAKARGIKVGDRLELAPPGTESPESRP